MLSVLAQVGGFGYDHMGGWGWIPGIIGLVFVAALIGLLFWLIVSVVRKPEQVVSTSGRARTLLDERYAKGEIDREEYLQRRSDLE